MPEMTLIKKENAIRRLLGLADVSGGPTKSGRLAIWDSEIQICYLPYYGGIDSIGMVLRDVVPRLGDDVFLSTRNGKGWDCYWDFGGKPDIEGDDLASMPAACCDALLRKEGLLT